MSVELNTYKKTVFEMYKEASRAGYYMQMVGDDHYVFYKFSDLVDIERHKQSIDIDLGRRLIFGSKVAQNKKVHLNENYSKAWYIDERGNEIVLEHEKDDTEPFWASVFTSVKLEEGV